jgi:DNA-binding NarL/FixJ family response regulator
MDAILIIDDNRVAGLAIAKMLLERGHLVMATDCASSFAELDKLRYDFVIITASNTDTHWRDVLDHIAEHHWGIIPIAIGVPHAGDAGDAAMQAINRGAQYFIAQPFAIEHILTAFGTLRARRGRKRTMPSEEDADQASPDVTNRERVVIDQVIAGHSNKDIAVALGTSEQYVKNILYRIYRRLRIRNRVGLIRHFGKGQADSQRS